MKTPPLRIGLLLLPVLMLAFHAIHRVAEALAGLLLSAPDAGPLALALQISHAFLAATLAGAAGGLLVTRVFGGRAAWFAPAVALPSVVTGLAAGLGPGQTPTDIFLAGWTAACALLLLTAGSALAARTRRDSAARH